MMPNSSKSPSEPIAVTAAGPGSRATPELIDAPPPSNHGRRLYEDVKLRIDREGTWYYHDSAIQRKEMVCLFASALTRDVDGGHWLATPAELVPVVVEDAPFIAVEMFVAGVGYQQQISFRTNVDEIVTVDEVYPLIVESEAETGEPRPYVGLRRRLRARLTRAVFYELVALSEERPVDGLLTVGVWSCGAFFPIGRMTAE